MMAQWPVLIRVILKDLLTNSWGNTRLYRRSAGREGAHIEKITTNRGLGNAHSGMPGGG